MANDGQIVFEVTADGRRAISDIRDITREIQNETKNWDNAAEQSAQNIGNSFSKTLKKLAGGFAAVKIGKALLDLGKDAINAASDLQEVQNVVDVTFGENSNKIEKWAKAAGTQFGLTETQAKRFSSTMGAMLKSSGLAGDKIVDVSTDLAGLAADMASFYNLDFDTAFQKIRSGISGQTMPLKELGIDMSVATLEAYAMSKGIKKAFSDMSQGEQTMLRYQYLMQATADAQGDFARTSDGYANSMRKLETNIDALKTKLGQPFLDVVANAVGALNGFLEMLMPDESKRTVLDDFADIDLKTEGKLLQIQKTAEEAGLLATELEKLNNETVKQAGENVQALANDLGNISFDQGKAGVFGDFIDTLSKNVDVIAALQGTDADGAKEWLEGIAESANKLDEGDAEGWKALLEQIREGLPGIESTDFGAAFFGALGGEFSGIQQQASVLEWVVSSLGDKTNKTEQQQALWLETCKRLVKTIPGLSSIINTETGEIKGGTAAVREYIRAWEEGQTKLALMGALAEKESALESRFSDLPGLQLDMAVAQRRARQARDKVLKLYEKYGLDPAAIRKAYGYAEDADIYDLHFVKGSASANQAGVTGKMADELNEASAALRKADQAARTATDAYDRQKTALDEAQISLKEYRETIEETYGTIEKSADVVEEWSEEAKANAQTLVEAVTDALNALDDHIQTVRDSTAKAIDSTLKGFEFVGDASARQAKRLEPLEKELKKLEEDGKDLGDINLRIADEKDIYSVQHMTKNLQSQLDFLKEYKADMEAAQRMGFSNQLLAQLSDGSVESASWLHELVNATPKDVEELNKIYGELDEAHKGLTDTLTAQQLSVDKVYESLAASAAEAVAKLNLEEDAAENSGKTIAGMAQGIADHVPEVQSAVDSIVEQLNRLDGWGINIDLGGFGSINFTTSTGTTDGSSRMGLDYVPFDDYIARLHEGEAVLTAEENRVWQGLHNGGLANVDLDSLGGVMRDNIKPGGNVYLDGKIVGSVVSDRQGRSYKTLQRSGWQT